MAKELDWKSSKAATPRGFESHVLRQMKEDGFWPSFFIFGKDKMGLGPVRACAAGRSGEPSGSTWSEGAPAAGASRRQRTSTAQCAVGSHILRQ